MAPGATRSFGNLAMSSAVTTNGFLVNIQSQQLRLFSEPYEMCVPITLEANALGIAVALAGVLAAFCEAARSQILQGVSARTVLSMDGIDMDLLFRDRLPSDPYTISTWSCEFAKSWSGYPLVLKFAAVHYIGTYVRWLVMPCQKTYVVISPLMRPLPSQLIIPHTADLDLCHLPPVREHQLVHGGRWVDNATPDSQSLNWPYGDEACVEDVFVPIAGEMYPGQAPMFTKVERMSSRFIQYIGNMSSWSVRRDRLEEVPGLRGQVGVYD